MKAEIAIGMWNTKWSKGELMWNKDVGIVRGDAILNYATYTLITCTTVICNH